MKKLLIGLILLTGCSGSFKFEIKHNMVIHEGELESIEYIEERWYHDYPHAIIKLKDIGQFQAHFNRSINLGAPGKKYRYTQFEHGYLKSVEEIK